MYNNNPVLFNPVKYVRVVEGTPFFDTTWMQGTATTPDGNKTKATPMRLNLLDNEVNYRDASGNEMIATIALKTLKLTQAATSKSWQFEYFGKAAPADQPGGWMEILTTTPQAVLYKRQYKQILESKPYGSSITEQRVNTSLKYYLLYNQQLQEIKKSDDLLKIAPDKAGPLQTAIKETKGKNDKDNYYLQIINSVFN